MRRRVAPGLARRPVVLFVLVRARSIVIKLAEGSGMYSGCFVIAAGGSRIIKMKIVPPLETWTRPV